MTDVPAWLGVLGGLSIAVATIITFWMRLSSQITKATVTADAAKADAKDANDKATILAASFSMYREQIARDYIHREVMREVEDRLTQAIERLGDRLDRVLGLATKQ